MMDSHRSPQGRAPLERRRAVLGAAILLSIGIFAVGEAGTGAGDSVTLLYVIAVALSALELGTRAGLATATAALGLIGIQLLTNDSSLGIADVLIRGFALLGTGAIAGRFSDRVRERRLGRPQLPAALDAELRQARGLLADQERRLELLLAGQEAERAAVAGELHDHAAQELAAIQIGLRALERDVGSERSRAQVESLRAMLAATVRSLRELATELRPPVLDQLGLEPALRGLASRASERSGDRVSLELDGIGERVPAALESTVYRVVDDIIAALSGGIRLGVGLNRARDELRIEARQSGHGNDLLIAPELLARIRARLDLCAGMLTVRGWPQRGLVASIPLPAIYSMPVRPGSPIPSS